ncbi:MAG: tRNA (adenosine(37)-N6)-threonylcarbamoyltransferase complex dimerization subunit type 1 TsaB [Trueperaceae bacterium]|nr:tRNA (adenosine(37)-N6)-threonylcarbamoyltransferase complex dimerization subunit type 1 TsaB [Trueperaceae bacterium]
MSKPSDLYLGIDSATRYLALALWSPTDGTLASVCPPVEREHAARIVPDIDALLAEVGATRHHLRGLGVGLGPGSYTGLRVGIAAAQGLARGLGVPLRGSSSLAAMAYAHLTDGEAALCGFDARRGNVYAARLRRKGDRVIQLGPLMKESAAALRERFTGERFIVDAPLDAGYLARQAATATTTSLTPLYL